MQKMELSSDLREMDEEQFKQLYQYLQEKTKNWTEFKPELLIENSRIILIIRCTLGFSQKEFATKLSATKDWVRHTESGRNKIIHIGPANRWCGKIERMLTDCAISLDSALQFFRQFKFAREQDLPKFKRKQATMSRLSNRELKQRFLELEETTNKFSIFDSKILYENPQRILIFRLLLGMGQRSFAKDLGITKDHIAKWERLRMKMKMETAEKICGKIEALIKNYNSTISFERTVNNLKLLRDGQGKRNLDNWIKNGLLFAQKQRKSPEENEILRILRKSGQIFDIHAIVSCIKRSINVDFAIPDSENPKFIIEVSKFSLKKMKLTNTRLRIGNIDHRFQMLKMKYPAIKTILCIRFFDKEFIHKEHTEELVSKELLNTDFLFINDFSKLPELF